MGRDKEKGLWTKGAIKVAGVDEAGRGPLAGPVVAAACVVPKEVHFEGVGDSKKINEETRNRLFTEITTHPKVEYSIVRVEHDEIDSINILQATFRAMERAIAGLPSVPNHVLIDGPYVPAGINEDERLGSEAIVKGDSKVFSIACASILAKVSRDAIMKEYHEIYPEYGFAQHKGYPTFAHRSAVLTHGPCPIHRRSFGPVRKALETFQGKSNAKDDSNMSSLQGAGRAGKKKRRKEHQKVTKGNREAQAKRSRNSPKIVQKRSIPQKWPGHVRRSPRIAAK